MTKEKSLCRYSSILHEITMRFRSFEVISFKFEITDDQGFLIMDIYVN
jgi:hypothetical protein